MSIEEGSIIAGTDYDYEIEELYGEEGLWTASSGDRKFIIKEVAKDSRYSVALSGELLLRLINHPNIVKVTDVFEVEDSVVVVEPYHQGVESKDYIKILFELLDAVAYLQENRIVHGDLHSHNIVWSKNGSPIIIDFGNATLVHGPDVNQSTEGTFFLEEDGSFYKDTDMVFKNM